MNRYSNVEDLNLRELLALTLREQPDSSVVEEIITRFDPAHRLYEASISELQGIKGLGVAKAARLKAILELGRRIMAARSEYKPVIKCPDDVAGLLMAELRFLDREHFKVLSLNTKNRVTRIETVAIGSLNSCLIHPREVFKNQIKHSAAAVILAHNHPSGDVTPSKEDTTITKRLTQAGKLLGIEVLDHVIIGDGNYYSFKEQGVI